MEAEANQKALAKAELDIKLKISAAEEAPEASEHLAKEAEQEAQEISNLLRTKQAIKQQASDDLEELDAEVDEGEDRFNIMKYKGLAKKGVHAGQAAIKAWNA